MRLEQRSDSDGVGSLWRRVLLCALAGELAIGAAVGCSTLRSGRSNSVPCDVLDSLYASSGFERPVRIAGHATVDANQYRVRGMTRVDARAPGEVTLEFTSTVLFGHEREDFILSLLGDTLRIVDRERGAYHEGAEAESYLEGSLETGLDVREVLPLALGGRPPCEELSEIRVAIASDGGVVCTGRRFGDRFRLSFGARHRRLEKVVWPVHSGDEVDRLVVDYDWGPVGGEGNGLRGIVLSLEIQEWRCRIKSSVAG